MTPDEQAEVTQLRDRITELEEQVRREFEYNNNLQFRDLRRYTVECYLCNKVTRDVMPAERGEPSTHQGDGCSTCVYQLDTGEVILQAGYGSKFDMDCFLVIDAELTKTLLQNKDFHNRQYSICDECISLKVRAQLIQPIEDAGISGVAFPIRPAELWPKYAVVSPENKWDELHLAHIKIRHLEEKLAEQSSYSAFAVLQKKYIALMEELASVRRASDARSK